MDTLFQQKKLIPEVLDRKCSQQLVRTVRNRFYLYGFFGLLLAPFVFVGVIVYFLFKYGEQVGTSWLFVSIISDQEQAW